MTNHSLFDKFLSNKHFRLQFMMNGIIYREREREICNIFILFSQGFGINTSSLKGRQWMLTRNFSFGARRELDVIVSALCTRSDE